MDDSLSRIIRVAKITMPSFKDIESIQYNRKKTIRRYFVEVVSSFSRFLNSILFNDSNLCLSSCLYKRNSKATKYIDMIYSFIEKEHCMKSYYYDLAKARKVITNHEESWRYGFHHCLKCSSCDLRDSCPLINREGKDL